MAIEIVDLPIENGGSFHSYVNVYQRVTAQKNDEKRSQRSLSKSTVVLHGPLTDLRGLGAGTLVDWWTLGVRLDTLFCRTHSTVLDISVPICLRPPISNIGSESHKYISGFTTGYIRGFFSKKTVFQLWVGLSMFIHVYPMFIPCLSHVYPNSKLYHAVSNFYSPMNGIPTCSTAAAACPAAPTSKGCARTPRWHPRTTRGRRTPRWAESAWHRTWNAGV